MAHVDVGLLVARLIATACLLFLGLNAWMGVTDDRFGTPVAKPAFFVCCLVALPMALVWGFWR